MTRSRGRRCRAALLVLSVLAMPAAARAEVRTVSLRASDGVPLQAEWHEPRRQPAPAVVLVHMLTRSRADWRWVAQRLADAGVGALAIDLRGHGGSAGSPGTSSSMLLDVQAALTWVRAQGGVSNGRVGVAGASLGANLAIMAAAADGSVHSLALLSPSLEYQGLRAEAPFRQCAGRPVLFVVGANDPYAVRSVRQLAAAGPGTREVRVLDGAAGHGTVMLERRPDLVRQLVDWFLATLL